MMTRRPRMGVCLLPVTINRDDRNAKGCWPRPRATGAICTFLGAGRCREWHCEDWYQSRIYFIVDNGGRREDTTAAISGSWTLGRLSNKEEYV